MMKHPVRLPSPPPQPPRNKTPSPSRPTSSSFSHRSPRPDTSRPLADINNTTATPTNLSGENSIDSSACLTPLSPVYLMYSKQQAKQNNGMFTIRPAFPAAKENKPTTSRGNLLSKSFTHEFPYDSSSEDSCSVSESETSSAAPTPRKQVSQAAVGQSLLHDLFPSPDSKASDSAASEDSTLKDSLSPSSALLSPQSSTGDSTLQELCSVASTPSRSVMDTDEEAASHSTLTGGNSIDLKYSTSYVTESTANTPEIFRSIPSDEPTPVIRNTTRRLSNGSDTMDTATMAPRNEKTTVIDWAVPRPSDRRNNDSPSLSLPSMLGGDSAFEVSDLESPSLFAQTMTSEGSSDIYSQSVRDESSEMLSTGGLDHIHTPSMMSGRPPRSMRGLTTPELWKHARKKSTTNRGLKTAPASLTIGGRNVFFRTEVPTPSPRAHLKKKEKQQRASHTPKAPVTLGSLLQDTMELQAEVPDLVFHDSSTDVDEEKEVVSDKGSDSTSEELTPPIDQDAEESEELDNNDNTDDDKESFCKTCCRRIMIVLVIILLFLLVLNAILIPLSRKNANSEVPDLATEVPTAAPRMPVSAPISLGPAPTAAPSISKSEATALPTARMPTAIPTIAPISRPTSPQDTPVERPSVVARPTTPQGAPVARPSMAGGRPTEPPNWTAVLEGELFWTNIDVQIELQWRQILSDRVEIEIVNALDDTYDEYLEATIEAWNASSFMDMTVQKVPQDVMCEPEAGKIKFCSAYYGDNGWRGRGQLYLRGRFIDAATIELNDYQVFDPDSIQYELCHLLGHSLGVYHDVEGCLVSNPTDAMVGDDLRYPSAQSLSYLEGLYGSQRRRRLGQYGAISGERQGEALRNGLDSHEVRPFHV